jgi:hypothetical protein
MSDPNADLAHYDISGLKLGKREAVLTQELAERGGDTFGLDVPQLDADLDSLARSGSGEARRAPRQSRGKEGWATSPPWPCGGPGGPGRVPVRGDRGRG